MPKAHKTNQKERIIKHHHNEEALELKKIFEIIENKKIELKVNSVFNKNNIENINLNNLPYVNIINKFEKNRYKSKLQKMIFRKNI